MTSDRPHREALNPVAAFEELERQAGKQFDPEVVEALLRILERGQVGIGQGSSPKVLIADEDEAFRKHLQMRLRNDGYEVETVDGAESALAAILKSAPNLVLASVGAGESEVFALLREIRSDESLRDLPFAFLGKSDDRILRIRALRQGVDDFMPKGGDLEELAARVENILTREATRRGGGGARRRRGITGRLENMGLPDIVQTLAIGMKTARIELSSDRRRGRIWFRDGSIVHAKARDMEGEEAFFEMVRWTDGNFVIEHGIRTRSTTIENDAMFLIMEGMRRMDEEAAGESETA
jgi:DNA-binding response OmpR family regulator